MIDQNNITAIIPVFRPQADCMNNLRFAVKKFADLDIKVIVLEQADDEFSYLAKFVENLGISLGSSKKVSFELYLSDSSQLNREAAINWLLQKKIRTDYAWIHDPNFYVKFPNILTDINSLGVVDFVVPYSTHKTLSQEETSKLVNGQELEISDFEVFDERICSSNIFFRKECWDILGGFLDGDFSKPNLISRVNDANFKFTILDNRGVYLYENTPIEMVPIMQFSESRYEKDMAIAVCHFNWCKYINPARNLNRFLRQMEIDDLPVYGVELSLDERFETTGRKNWKQITVQKENVCFQKEACINFVEKFIPEKYQKIAWIDPDLHFTNKNWYRETSAKLETHKLIQMYSQGYSTDRYGRMSRRHPSVMAMYGMVPMDYWFQHPGHPGGAWGARRELWNNGGLYPYCLVGGGDTVFVYTLFGYDFPRDVYASLGLSGEAVFEPYAVWKDKITNYIKPEDVTYINNSFIHEWHGDRVKRNYNLRHDVMKKINIFRNVCLNDMGFVEIVNLRLASTYSSLFNYFKSRDEDGVIGDMEDFLEYKSRRNEDAI